MMNIDATVYFVIKGVTLVKKGEAEKIKMGSFPSLREVMDQAVKAGVKLMVCEQSCSLLGIPRGDFTAEAKIVGAATLNDLALSADTVLCF
jgi:predicted peroxiredoxin